MNNAQNLEERIVDYYEAEVPPRAPDWLLARALDVIDSTPQRKIVLRRPWGIPMRPSFAKLAMMAVAIVAISSVGLALLWGPVIGPVVAPSPTASSSPVATSSGGMWPQSTLEEVRQAQALADAGDPAYTWQVDWDLGSPRNIGQNHPGDAEILTRFLQEKLGWEEFLWDEAFAHRDSLPGDVIYVRCAPGGANPLYPDQVIRLPSRRHPPEGGCGPTIDQLRYETVKINLAQPDRQGPRGIWVVTSWEMIQPASQADPRVIEAEVTTLLERFLQARIDGRGADDYVAFADFDPITDGPTEESIPLMYATSTGARYVRSDFALGDGPLWPEDWKDMRPEVGLFADDDSVVEQVFSLDRDDTGRLRLVFDSFPTGPTGPFPATTENGEPVPVVYGFLDGAVTYRAAFLLGPSQDGHRGGLRGCPASHRCRITGPKHRLRPRLRCRRSSRCDHRRAPGLADGRGQTAFGLVRPP